MKAKVTDAELVAVLRLIAEHGGSISEAARASGRNRPHLSELRSIAQKRGLTVSTVVISEEDKLRADNKRLTADLAAALQRADDDARVREEVFGLAARTPEPPEWLQTKQGKNGARGCPQTLWSDWHYGEVVRADEVGGVNEFDAKIAEKRIKRLVDTTIDLCFHHIGRATTNYPGIVIGLNGDIMTGNIHDELRESNDRTPQAQINDLTDLIASAIENMAAKFGKVFVPCNVGNHGRGTMKPRMKNRIRTSYEWVIYTNLERHFKREKNIRFHVPLDTDSHFKVYNHRYLQTHGDTLGVKGGDGIIGAIGPIMRGSLKVGRSEAQIGNDFDTIIMGHWHQMLWLPGAIVNNSLKGYDEFAKLALRAPYSRPSQALWFTHPEHGITAKWEVFLEGQRQAAEASEWVSWQQIKAGV